jgi:serine phosphatase RsbU (regulator of sigma subunit)/anti-sigma regulatory factor (Ser/Thr protein kinase)/tetratricopeptide (TPR) repeat protein
MFKKVIKEQWEFPANIDYLGDMRDTVTEFGRKYGVSEQVINAFKLAIDEAGTNIIRHAYRDWDGKIILRMIVRDKTVTVSLIDQGHTFDLRKVQDPDLQRYVDIGKKGGLGIFIIRRVIDKIDYRKTPEGNELRLSKNRRTRKSGKLIGSDLPFTMKTRFSLIASTVLTFFVLAAIVWNYFVQEDKILRGNLASGQNLTRSLVHQCADPLAKGHLWEISAIVSENHREWYPKVSEIIVLDTANIVQGLVNLDSLMSKYEMLSDAKQIQEGIFLTKTWAGKTVYDIIEPAVTQVQDREIRLGSIHLMLDKQVIDSEVVNARRRIVLYGAIILVLGYGGIFGLVYLTLSPFKKLSKWVRDLGHGEVHDELEFNSSDEIGEIAQAFNEITEKFRKSQENVAEQERLQKEMQVAQEIQHTLLPASFPDVEGYELSSYYEAAKEVGGDYFDFFKVDRDTLGIAVADVSGKGVPGSLVMTMIRTALRTEARGNKNAADVLSKVNDFVINDMKRGMFVTVFYIILDSKRRIINYASAGHNPMILYRGQSQKSYYLNPRGFPIGINLPDRALFRKSIESDSLQLRQDDVLIVYTDGITEAMDKNRNRFGDERFLSILRRCGALQAKPLVDRIKEDIQRFTGGHAQSDDITLVAIREKLAAEDVLFNHRNDLLQMVKDGGMSVKEACEKAGVSTSTYYKYKKLYEKEGKDGLKESVTKTEVEEKHIAIEDRAKIYDVIKQAPELGPKRISEELNTEKYGFLKIDENRIYDELVRSRLNTKELRMAFIERGGRGKRMKPPGTPFLSLDGKVIIEPTIRRIPVPPPKPALMQPPGEEEAKVHGTVPETSEQDSLQIVDLTKKSDTLGDGTGITIAEDAEEIDKEMHRELVSRDANERAVQKEEERISQELSEIPESEENGPSEVFTDLEEMESSHDQKKMDFEEQEFDDFFSSDEGLAHALLTGSDESFGITEPESGHAESHASFVNMDEILETDNPLLVNEQIDHRVEESISSSAVEDLMGEVTGDLDVSRSAGSVPIEEEAGFVEMMEGLGFNRRDVFQGGKRSEAGKKAAQYYQRIRFHESGQWFYREGLYARAIEEFRKAIECDPKFGEAYQCIGDSHFRLGQLDKAKQFYLTAKELNPDNIDVLENLGVIYANQGDYRRSVWQWGEVIKRDPSRQDIIERIKRMQRVIRQRAVYHKRS